MKTPIRTSLLAACFVAAAVMGALTGCVRETSAGGQSPFVTVAPGGGDMDGKNVRPIRDAETGCEYILVTGVYTSSLTPRMGFDGRQICRGAVQ